MKALLKENWPNAEIHCVSSGKELFGYLSRGGIDAILLNASLGKPNIVRALENIASNRSKPRVLVIGNKAAPSSGIQMLQAGGYAYWTDDDPCDLKPALEQVLAGKSYISPTLVEGLARTVKNAEPKKSGSAALSQRERQVFELLARGCTLKEIAKRLRLNSKTVSTFRHRLMLKMNLKSNLDLLKYYWADCGGGAGEERKKAADGEDIAVQG